MISCILMGGLGNQLFQIFTTISLAIDCNKPFYFQEKLVTEGMTKRYTYWNTFLRYLRIHTHNFIPQFNVIKEINFEYNEISKDVIIDSIHTHGNVHLNGYYQSHKYFEKNKNQLFELINLEKQKLQVSGDMDLSKSISLHFRIGDYKNLSKIYPIMNYEYYKNCLLFIKNKINIDGFSVFCFYEENDYEHVSLIIEKLEVEFYELSFIRIDKVVQDWQQLLLMSCCQHNIIANSTFSWWGAYFNSNNNKIVCYPDTWFQPSVIHNTKDLFPDEWNKILFLEN